MNRMMVTAAMLSAGLLTATTAAAESKRGPSYDKACSAYGRGGVKSCFVQDGAQFCGACKTHAIAVKPAKGSDGDVKFGVGTPAASSPVKGSKATN